MSKVIRMQTAGFTLGLAVLLAGCGDSHPIAGPSPAAVASAPAVSGPASPAPAYKPSAGSFTVVAAGAVSQPTEPSGKCNLDAIDGAPVGSKAISRGKSALFAGWAASNDGNAVPQTVAIMLRGRQDFEVQAPTGAPRPDVAAANQEPVLASSGYAVNASLAGVAAGSYKVELRYAAGGKTWRCEAAPSLTVE